MSIFENCGGFDDPSWILRLNGSWIGDNGGMPAASMIEESGVDIKLRDSLLPELDLFPNALIGDKVEFIRALEALFKLFDEIKLFIEPETGSLVDENEEIRFLLHGWALPRLWSSFTLAGLAGIKE